MRNSRLIILVVLLCCIGMAAFSQDVIVTKSGEQIRAKILEVSDDNISYKKYHDPEGATFILSKDKIKIISWENGDVDDYEKNLPVTEIVPDIASSTRLPFIDRQGKTFYLDNGLVYDGSQLQQFLIDNQLESVWNQYVKGNDMLGAGWTIIGVGVALEIAGIAFIVSSPDGKSSAGTIFCALGGFCEIIGIPMTIVGTAKKNNAINGYNRQYGGKSRFQHTDNVSFKAGVTGNGIGFMVNF